jgi:type VI secretion system secreted protein VgrG
MSVTLNPNNIHRYAHIHCFVADPDAENGYARSELVRYLEVENIVSTYSSQEEGQCTAKLTIEDPRSEELAQIRWTVEGREEPQYNGKITIVHNLKEEKMHEINFTAYIEGKPDRAANARLIYDEKAKQLTNLRFEDE